MKPFLKPFKSGYVIHNRIFYFCNNLQVCMGFIFLDKKYLLINKLCNFL
ncbi:hypothetical protein XNC3_800024 [Xenorhabdus nematophila F1]|nr:hypothetical protein XNC3_800024 [Xenorhabdus nematophila F1]